LNYYEHHLGDYDGATAHLSWLEDCAYRRLICLYYRTEAPIPGDMKQACRLVRAASKPERDAVQQVLAEFFVLVDGAWHHDRCDAEIGEYQEGEPDREARRENARERQRRSRERRKALFETLRSHNIVPPFDTKTPELETPDTKHQIRIQRLPAPSPRPGSRRNPWSPRVSTHDMRPTGSPSARPSAYPSRPARGSARSARRRKPG
jgi:uncharacterized protein YdaU (DUF1376 family)